MNKTKKSKGSQNLKQKGFKPIYSEPVYGILHQYEHEHPNKLYDLAKSSPQNDSMVHFPHQHLDLKTGVVRDHSYHPEDTRLAHDVQPDDRSYLDTHRHDLLREIPHEKLIVPVKMVDHQTQQSHTKWVDSKLAA